MPIGKIQVLAAAASVFALALTGAACAAPAVKDIVLSADLQKKFEKDYGVRDAEFLKKDLRERVQRSLSKVESSKVAYVTLLIEDAKPNRPTFGQMSKNTSLSFGDSIGLGGARVEAKLYDSKGALIGTVAHRYFTHNLSQVTAQSTWSDAQHSFNRTAAQIRKEAEKAG